MNNFEFENRTKVCFGKGVVAEKLPVLAAGYGGKVLLGYGGGSIKKNGVYDEVTGILKDAGVEIVEFSGIMSNPTLEKMQEGARLAKEQGVTWILAVGGGSVMDCCKSISIAVPYDGDVWEEFWEKPGNLNFDPLPLGMIVTMPATGSEVKKGLIQDTFTPVVKEKLAAYGIETISTAYSGDGVENVANAIGEARKTGADLILCTGGMSVDPDDNTPGGIRASGARIVTYGAPVLPGAMFLLGYFEDGTPICGLPGCVMYAGATIFDLALPRIAAGVELTRRDFAVMGEGGLCLGCKPCHWPNCPFGK